MTRLPNTEDIEIGNKFLLLCPESTAGDIYKVTAVAHPNSQTHPNGFFEGDDVDIDKEVLLNEKYCFFNGGNREFNIGMIRGEIPYCDDRYLFAIPLNSLSDEDVFQYKLSGEWDHLQYFLGHHKKWIEVTNDMLLELNGE